MHWLPDPESSQNLQQPVSLGRHGYIANLFGASGRQPPRPVDIERVFGQLADLLQEAGLEVEGLFLNADAGFDSEQFRQICSALKIEANIAFNPRNGIVTEDYVYFD